MNTLNVRHVNKNIIVMREKSQSVLKTCTTTQTTYLSACLYFSCPLLKTPMLQSTHLEKPSFNNNSAIFPAGWITVPKKFWFDTPSKTI